MDSIEYEVPQYLTEALDGYNISIVWDGHYGTNWSENTRIMIVRIHSAKTGRTYNRRLSESLLSDAIPDDAKNWQVNRLKDMLRVEEN